MKNIKIDWPWAIGIVATVTGVVILAIAAPEQLAKILDTATNLASALDERTLGALLVLIGGVLAALRPPTGGAGGSGDSGGPAPRQPTILPPAARVALALALALCLPGCGTSALRTHAQAATVAHVALATAGDAIERATRSELDACPAIAPARSECIDHVEHIATTAAAARDALIAPVAAYRDAVLVAGAAGDSDAVIAALIAAGGRVLREWPALVAALYELGIEVPALPIAAP